jgi:hypothetical protein
VGLESHIPDDIRVRVGEPLGRMGTGRETGLSEGMSGKQAFGGATGGGTRGAEAQPVREVTGGGGGGTETAKRIVIPITLKLDGETVAKVVQKYEMNEGRERYMNAPNTSLRGTGG